jgi:acyl phosphate:glycerol-3-phosphate acyltransferase
MSFAVLIVAAYLLGSVPFGIIIARAHGKDLRKIGSGNIGATNLSRALGRKWGYICFAMDVSKSLVPMLIAMGLLSLPPTTGQLFLWLAVGMAAIAGHIFPIFAGFKGGKGVATSFGVALGLYPYFTVCAAIALGAWLIVVLIWRYVSLGSIIASVIFPAALAGLIATKPDWTFAQLWPLLVAATLIPLMVIIRHRQNIKRILAGTEDKVLKR